MCLYIWNIKVSYIAWAESADERKLIYLFLRLTESSIVKFVRKFQATLSTICLSHDNIPWESAYRLFFWRLHILQRRHIRPRAYVFILMRYPAELNLLSCGALRRVSYTGEKSRIPWRYVVWIALAAASAPNFSPCRNSR